jgi:hypothetical protein
MNRKSSTRDQGAAVREKVPIFVPFKIGRRYFCEGKNLGATLEQAKDGA